jgi:hypothetical protein
VVAILLGFPVSLVWLWMFESAEPNEPAAAGERRRGQDPAAALVRLMEDERLARQRDNQELIATLAQLKGEAAAQPPASPPTAMPEQPLGPPPPVPVPPAPRPNRTGVLLAVLALLIVLSGVWALLAPQEALQSLPQSGQLAQDYVVPGFHRAEHFGVELLRPVLHKFGLGIAPERVLTVLMVLLALLVMRDFYRQLIRARTRRARQP